jgi:hypothetical protein
MPAPDDFSRVPCDDLSSGGISFFLPEEPQFVECVVGLGKPPEVTYVRARVTYHEPVIHRGVNCVRVGCQFKSRLPSH